MTRLFGRFHTQKYVVGTQRTVSMRQFFEHQEQLFKSWENSTQNDCSNVENNHNFTLYNSIRMEDYSMYNK